MENEQINPKEETNPNIVLNVETEKNCNMNGNNEIVVHTENTNDLQKVETKENDDKERIQQQEHTDNILSDESFERKFLNLKEKIKKHKVTFVKHINITSNNTNRNEHTTSPISNKRQSMSPLPSSSARKIRDLFSMLAPLENSNSMLGPSLQVPTASQNQTKNTQHQQDILQDTKQSTFIPHYNPINNNQHKSKGLQVKSTIAPRLFANNNKNIKDILQKGKENKIKPTITNSYLSNMLTVGNKDYHQYQKPLSCNQRKINIGKTSINLDLNKCFEKSRNKGNVYKKEYFLNELDSFGNKLFGDNYKNAEYTSRVNKRKNVRKNKLIIPTGIKDKKQSSSNFYDLQKVKRKNEPTVKFNRLNLVI